MNDKCKYSLDQNLNNVNMLRSVLSCITGSDPKYIKMSDDFERSLAFKTACDLVFKGKKQPSGYTEPLLHQNRLKKKFNLS